MPPKKQAPVEEAKGYDLQVMNRADLKAYAKVLESDIEYLRNYSNFYKKAGDKLGDFYASRVDELSRLETAIVDKGKTMETIREKVAQDLLSKSDFEAYDAYVNERRDEQQEKEISDRLEKALEEHVERENVLKEVIDEKERELAAEKKTFKMTRRDALEKSAKRMEDVEEKDRILFEKSMMAYADMLTDTKKLNKMALDSIKKETLEAKRSGETQFQERVLSYKKELQKYYKDITRQDLNNIKGLTQKAKKLEDSIKSTQSRLKTLFQQNEELEESQRKVKAPSKFKPQNPETHQRIMKGRRTRNLKRIEELKAENLDLHQQIKVALEQSDNLRRQFSRALFQVKKNAQKRTEQIKKKLETEADGDENLEKARDAIRQLEEMPDLAWQRENKKTSILEEEISGDELLMEDDKDPDDPLSGM